MNTIALRHHHVTLAYRASPFNTHRAELAKRIRQFLNLRRFRQHLRSLTSRSIY